MKDIYQKIAYAASTDESRAILNGALMSFKEGKLTSVCTDGRRLGLVEEELETGTEAEIEVVVPTKTGAELIKLLGQMELCIFDYPLNRLHLSLGIY